jgi:hypothetical protein
MDTPFYASKLGTVVIATVLLWMVAAGAVVLAIGPKHAAADFKHQLRRYHASRTLEKHGTLPMVCQPRNA